MQALLRARVEEQSLQVAQQAQLIEQLKKGRNAADREIRRLIDMTRPAQVRRVVRTIVYEGSPEWVARTLARSLRDGRTGLRDGAAAITVKTLTDETVDRVDLPRADRDILPSYTNQAGDTPRAD